MALKTTTKIREEHAWLPKELKKANVRSELWRRPPMGRLVFTTTVNRSKDTIMLWPGDENEFEIHTDKSHRQAVVQVHEPEHTFTATKKHSQNRSAPELKTANHMLTLPEKSKVKREWKTKPYQLSYDDYLADARRRGRGYIIRERDYEEHPIFRGTVTFEITTPEATRTLLMGIDETAHFIAMLKKPVGSVEEAHEALRPKNVPAGALRQGEFFFVPVNDERLKKALYNKLADQHVPWDRWSRSSGRALGQPVASRSDHIGTATVIHNNNRYVFGLVTHPRHSGLILDGWHKVVHNEEIVDRRIQPAQRRYWD